MQIETTIAIIRVTYRGSEKPVKFESKGVGHNENYHQRKNIDVTEGLKPRSMKTWQTGEIFTPDTNVIVTLSVEKERQKIEVTNSG